MSRRRLRRADHRSAREPEQREAARQPDHDQQHAHHLHDRNAAHIGLELGGERDDLRHRARRRPEESRGPVPAVDEPQKDVVVAIMAMVATASIAMLSG